jgi:hypothetical protein
MIGMSLVPVLMGIPVAVLPAILVRIPIAVLAAIVMSATIVTMHLRPLHRTIVGPAATLRPRDRASLRTAKGRSFFVSRHYPRSVEFPRTRGGGDGGATVVL